MEFKNNSCSVLAEILKVRSQYVDMIKDNRFSIPKKHQFLNTESASWCLEKLDVFNSKNTKINELKNLCLYYKELIEYNDEISRKIKGLAYPNEVDTEEE